MLPSKYFLTSFIWWQYLISVPYTSRYRCTRKTDGIAIVGPIGEEEGSDEPDISYTCDGVGNYTFPRDNVTNEVILPKCLERRKSSEPHIS